jgi:hypothetical protein
VTTIPILRQFVTTLNGAVRDVGSFSRRPEFWPAKNDGIATADAGILASARRVRGRPVKALGIHAELSVTGNICNDLIARRVSEDTVTVILTYAAGDVLQAETVPRRVVENPLPTLTPFSSKAIKIRSIAPAPQSMAVLTVKADKIDVCDGIDFPLHDQLLVVSMRPAYLGSPASGARRRRKILSPPIRAVAYRQAPMDDVCGGHKPCYVRKSGHSGASAKGGLADTLSRLAKAPRPRTDSAQASGSPHERLLGSLRWALNLVVVPCTVHRNKIERVGIRLRPSFMNHFGWHVSKAAGV